jgi:hypothetical protein
MPAYLLEVEGKMLDFGTPEEYANTFRTIASLSQPLPEQSPR